MSAPSSATMRDMSSEARLEALFGNNSEGKESAWYIRVYESVTSTMDVAREACSSPDFHAPGLLMARVQSSGRGRSGRVWESTAGSLFVTYVFQTAKNARELQGFSLVVGCAVADALESFGAAVLLKWPNDILDQQLQKLGGILIEVHAGPQGSYVSVGLGLNMSTLPEQVPGAGCLHEIINTEPTVEEIAVSIGARLLNNWQRFEYQGFSSFRDRWLARACFLGAMVSMESSQKPTQGIFVGIGPHGEALLDSEGKVFSMVSGDMLRVV